MFKTIIRTPNHLGDVIMAMGAIKAFAERSPDSEIYLLVPEWAGSLFDRMAYVKLIPLESKALHGIKAIYRQTKIISSYKFDIGIVLPPSFSSAMIFFLSGVTSRYGYDSDRRSLFLSNSISGSSVMGRHRSEKYIALLQHVAGHQLCAAKPHWELSPDKIDETTRYLNHLGISRHQEFITLGPQAVAPSRCWDINNFSELTGRLGRPTVLVGAANEYSAGQEIVLANKHVINLCGQTDIATAGAIISLAKLYIGNDSGLAHLAAAVGTPLVVLFGAGNPAETAPLSDNIQLIIKSELGCISCVKNVCPLTGTKYMQCLKLITVDEVYEKAMSLM